MQALDRDPPKGKANWKLKVRVSDGQKKWDQNRKKPFFGGNILDYSGSSTSNKVNDQLLPEETSFLKKDSLGRGRRSQNSVELNSHSHGFKRHRRDDRYIFQENSDFLSGELNMKNLEPFTHNTNSKISYRTKTYTPKAKSTKDKAGGEHQKVAGTVEILKNFDLLLPDKRKNGDVFRSSKENIPVYTSQCFNYQHCVSNEDNGKQMFTEIYKSTNKSHGSFQKRVLSLSSELSARKKRKIDLSSHIERNFTKNYRNSHFFLSKHGYQISHTSELQENLHHSTFNEIAHRKGHLPSTDQSTSMTAQMNTLNENGIYKSDAKVLSIHQFFKEMEKKEISNTPQHSNHSKDDFERKPNTKFKETEKYLARNKLRFVGKARHDMSKNVGYRLYENDLQNVFQNDFRLPDTRESEIKRYNIRPAKYEHSKGRLFQWKRTEGPNLKDDLRQSNSDNSLETENDTDKSIFHPYGISNRYNSISIKAHKKISKEDNRFLHVSQKHSESHRNPLSYTRGRKNYRHVLARNAPSRVNSSKRSVLVNQLGINLDSGGCLDPSPDSLYPQIDGSALNLFDEYQRLLRIIELEKGVRRPIHVVETEVTVVVKDINDNQPTFPNSTMFGEVQENGPIGE